MGTCVRNSERMKEIHVVIVGDSKVGKSSLISQFIHHKFSENYRATSSLEKYVTTGFVANRKIKYIIWDTTGTHSSFSSRSSAYKAANVFILAYKITDPSSLFSALHHWAPELSSFSSSTPILLLGTQSDLRRDRDVLFELSKKGRAPISIEQAQSFSSYISAAGYVETSSKGSAPSGVENAFEMAATASLAHYNTSKTNFYPKPTYGDFVYNSPSSITALEHSSSSSCSSPNSVTTPGFWDIFSSSPKLNQTSYYPESSRISVSSSSRSASLHSYKTRSSHSSIPSITSANLTPTGSKTPRPSRKVVKSERMTVLKCQRLSSEKTVEEVEIEVPVPIYETLALYNYKGSLSSNPKELRRHTLGNKLKNLFSRN